MNRKWKSLLTVLAVFPIFLLTTNATAVERKGPPSGCHDQDRLSMLEAAARLDLSAEQKSKILDIVDRYRKARENLHLQLRELPAPADGPSPSGEISEDALRKQIRAVSAIQEELFVLPLKLRQELAAVLTTEQGAILDRLERQDREREFPGHGGPPPHRP